jgi:gamma-glutamyl:cysteine ligase YbdK (ATP-grasp superfamily)
LTIGVEEELILLNPSDLSFAQSAEKALRRLSGELPGHTDPEMHASVIELAAGIHPGVVGAVAELAVLRAPLDREPCARGLTATLAGIYPLPCSGETRVSGSARYVVVGDSMGMLARREPRHDWRRRGSNAALQGRNSRRRQQRLPEG